MEDIELFFNVVKIYGKFPDKCHIADYEDMSSSMDTDMISTIDYILIADLSSPVERKYIDFAYHVSGYTKTFFMILLLQCHSNVECGLFGQLDGLPVSFINDISTLCNYQRDDNLSKISNSVHILFYESYVSLSETKL